MGDSTSIEWADRTFQPWIGCSKVSPGCTNCYAEVSTPVRVSRSRGLELWGRDAARRPASEAMWKQPAKWNREAQAAGRRDRVFCASLADVFEDRTDLDMLRIRLFDTIRLTPHLDWLLLTKRPEHVLHILRRVGIAANSVDVARMCAAWCGGEPPVNVWMGTTVEDQQRADERIPALLNIPAHVRFLSVEPMLGPVDLSMFFPGIHVAHDGELRGRVHSDIQWVIVGGESGSKARPFAVEWARAIVEQCRAAGVAPFVKQMGANVVDRNTAGFDGEGATEWPADTAAEHGPLGHQGADVIVHLDDRKGGDWDEWPEDLRVREFPTVRP